MKKKLKKKHKYEKQQYPSFNVNYQVANRKELLDQDYIDKLSPSEKKWLDAFNQETIITNFNHSGKKHYNSKKKRREIYKENNLRNKDIFSNLKANNKLLYSGSVGKEKNLSNQNVEDYLTSIKETNTFNSEEDYLLTMILLKKLFNEES